MSVKATLQDGAQPAAKRVVFNADDFGANPITNAAVIRAHREGILTSASLMMNEAAAAEAIELARENPALGVGLHLVLSNGRAALPRSQIAALVNASGRFPDNPATAGIRAFFRSAARRQVRAEIAEQFARFAETGSPWSHVDGHQHLHLHPVIWDALVDQCVRYSVKWVRVPFEEFRPASRERILGRRMEWLFFRALRKRCMRSLQRLGISTADSVYGHLETGRISESYLLDLLPRVSGEVVEIYSHPGTPHAAPLSDFGEDTDVELHALLSSQVRELCQRLGYCVTSFRAPNACLSQPSAEQR